MEFVNLLKEHNRYLVAVPAQWVVVPSTLSYTYWVPPLGRWIKVNVDAAIFGEGLVGLGCVGRSEVGKLVFMGAIRLEVNWDASWVEFVVAKLGVLMARLSGYERVSIEGDKEKQLTSLRPRKTRKSF